MVVMTDGNENVDPSVVDPLVQAAISWFNDRVYAIGLGTETNVSAATLGAIAVYQLITGNITSFQQQFLLTKYFLQILAQVTDSAIVVDPQGELRRGDEHRIPFDIGEGDVSIDVVALSPLAPLLDFTLEAPDGTLIGPGAGPNVTFQLDAGDEFYRVLLPAIPGNAAGTHAGRWTAILGIRDPRKVIAPGGLTRVEGSTNVLANVDRQALQAVATRGALPYTLFVQSYSNLKMRVEVRQDSYLPGATLTLVAVLTEYRIPLRGPARVIVEVTEPDGREVQVQLDEVEPGRFSGAHVTGGAGIYRCRFRAHGTTRGGKLFQREDTRTAAINARLAPGGDLSSTVPGGGGGDHDRERWCALIACLLREPSIIRLLQKHDVDPAEIAACVKRYCTMARVSPSVAPTRSAATSAEDVVMSEETERLKNELTRLRAELKKEAAFDSVRWDDLLTPAPKAVATPPKPERAADEHVHHESHHTRALPALVTDEDGNTRVLLPAGHGASVEQRGGRGQGGGPEDGGHDHGPTGGGADSGGGHTHGHGEADRRPKKR
jgi:hypothetical protein